MGPIKFIFPLFVIAMWAVCGLGIANGGWTSTHWLLLALGHLGCAIIFANFVWVFSYGYGISMVLANAAAIVANPRWGTILVGTLGIAYGLRLTWFVYRRYNSQGYATTRANGERANSGIPLPFRLFMWVCCSWLMAFVAMPALVVGASGATKPGVLAGAALMLLGLVLESIADAQKQDAKTANPQTFVTTGLYARLRHPNYLGEIIFQIGLLVAGLSAAVNEWQLALCVPGPLYIAILMYYAARDQDRQQSERYGADPAYAAYRSRSHSLVPGL
jgi:steroid 5-alpha reductase family enzyme